MTGIQRRVGRDLVRSQSKVISLGFDLPLPSRCAPAFRLVAPEHIARDAESGEEIGPNSTHATVVSRGDTFGVRVVLHPRATYVKIEVAARKRSQEEL